MTSTNLDAAPNSICERELGLSGAECELWQATILPEKLPPARGNSHGDDIDAARLGYFSFFEGEYSPKKISCVICHKVDLGFTDRKPYSKGIELVTRNAPTLLNSAWLSRHFWDGRADSVWTQPLFTIEHPKEMGSTRLEVAHALDRMNHGLYEKVFGPLPDLSDKKRFPARGSPGMPEFEAMAPLDREFINQIYVNFGKSLEAYIRKLATRKSKVDLYLEGDTTAVGLGVKRGMIQYTRARCFDCHSGPMFTDEKFHNIGVPAWPDTPLDRGRAQGLKELIANPFNSSGKYFETSTQVGSGQSPSQAEKYNADLLGTFLTPSLRNLAISPPYGHNGRFATIDEMIDFHLQGGGKVGFVGKVDSKLKKVRLSYEERKDLATFLGALLGDQLPLPWRDWPHH